MYQVSENSLDQLEEINEQIAQMSDMLDKLSQDSTLKGADYRQHLCQLQDSEGPQVRHFNHLWSLESRLSKLIERKQEICSSLLDYLIQLPGQSRKDFALEYYFHGIRNFREIADRIGLSIERTYHLHKEVKKHFIRILQQDNDRNRAEDDNHQQCADGKTMIGW